MINNLETINSLLVKREDLSLQINRLQQEKRNAEIEMVRELMEAGLHNCFSINWRAVHRITRTPIS